MSYFRYGITIFYSIYLGSHLYATERTLYVMAKFNRYELSEVKLRHVVDGSSVHLCAIFVQWTMTLKTEL